MSVSAAAWCVYGFAAVSVSGGVLIWRWNERRNPDAWHRSPLCDLALALMRVGVMLFVASSAAHVLSAVDSGVAR